MTNTMPLHIEILYNEYDFVGAFSVASLLACLALLTLVAQAVVERMGRRRGGVGVVLSKESVRER
jgi:sulfate transport system permease protein